MVDIIIPAFNAQEYISRALASVSIQRMLAEIKVTIVNDGGDDDYAEIIKSFPQVNIQEINTGCNIGPGGARQFGIEHTDGKYIVFLDADDVLCSASSVNAMTALLEIDETVNVAATPINEVRVGEDKQLYVNTIEPGMTWVFGHAYRRSFIEKYNIRFPLSSANEDVSFNHSCFIISNHFCGKDSVRSYAFTSYEWNDFNQRSIVRNPDKPFLGRTSFPGFVYGRWFSYMLAIEAGIDLHQISENIVLSFISFYFYYMHALQYGVPEIVTEAIVELSRMYYYDFYMDVRGDISNEKFLGLYQTADRESSGDQTGPIVPTMTYNDFVKMIESEPRKEVDYQEIERAIKAI